MENKGGGSLKGEVKSNTGDVELFSYRKSFLTRHLVDKYVNFQLVPAFRFCFFGTPSCGGNVKGGKCFKVGTCPQYCELLDFSQLCIKKSPLTP